MNAGGVGRTVQDSPYPLLEKFCLVFGGGGVSGEGMSQHYPRPSEGAPGSGACSSPPRALAPCVPPAGPVSLLAAEGQGVLWVTEIL